MLEFEKRNQRTTKIEKKGLMNILQRAFENYRIQQKQRSTAIWIEEFCLGLIAGVIVIQLLSIG